MRLNQHADMRAARVIHGDLRLDAELPITVDPDDARVDRARGLPLAARQRNFDDGDQVRERLRQADVAHVLLQIGQAVLHGHAVIERIRLAGARRERGARLARDRDGAQIRQRIGQVAEALAGEDRRRDGREALANRVAARAAQVRIDAYRRHELVRLVHVQQVLEADAEVVEAVRGRIVLPDVGASERHREARRNQLVVLEAEAVDALVAIVAAHALVAVFQIEFVADAGIVDGHRRGEDTVARNRVRVRNGRSEQGGEHAAGERQPAAPEVSGVHVCDPEWARAPAACARGSGNAACAKTATP
ncbi:hypothetical protein BCAR13_610014 [Paraburkholderia caribensis]|nr:hypothetical protein BCAR13_610014 [Paraburkholderia caribensis]